MYRLNKYSLFLITIYFLVVVVMGYHSNVMQWEGLFISAPFILPFVFWSQFRTRPKTEEEDQFTAFYQDFFNISYSFLIGELLSILMQYNNSDVRGWWLFALCFIMIIGFIIALIYSLGCLLLDQHKRYTQTCSFIIVVFLIFMSIIHILNPLSIIASDSFFYGVLMTVLTLHLCGCITWKILKSKQLSN